jgi:hypothetical protein
MRIKLLILWRPVPRRGAAATNTRAILRKLLGKQNPALV